MCFVFRDSFPGDARPPARSPDRSLRGVRAPQPVETAAAEVLREVRDAQVVASEHSLPADLVLLAMGFLHPEHENLLTDLGVKLDPRGNVAANTTDFATSEPGVLAAGDCRRGQSLVVWAMWEGREAARAVDAYLMGTSRLQSRHAFI